MKRIVILLLLTMILPRLAFAKSNDHYKLWHEGDLMWSDFQDTISLKGVQFSFNAFLRIEQSRTKKGNTITVRPEAQACFDRYHSSANPEVQNKNLLRLFQLRYNLLEMYRRKLQTELNLGTSGIAADNRKAQYMNLYNEQCQRAIDDTRNGQDEIKLQEWEFYVIKELEENPAPSIPQITPRKFGYGFSLGTGAVFSTQSACQYWAPAWQVNFGVDLAYANTHLLCDFSAGTARTKQDIFASHKEATAVWGKGGHNTYTSISLGIGQQLVSTKYFAFMPYAGCIWSGYSDQAREENGINEKISFSYSNFNWTAGLCFDYRFSNTISLVPSFWSGHRETFTASICTRIFINHEQYKNFNNIPGNTLQDYKLGFSISCLGFSRLLHIN